MKACLLLCLLSLASLCARAADPAPTHPLTLDTAGNPLGTTPLDVGGANVKVNGSALLDSNGHVSFSLQPVGTGPNTLAAGNDPRLVAAPRVVPTVAALRALPVPVAGVDSGHVVVQGYYAPGDGGGGEYAWDATATGRITGLLAQSIFQSGAGYAADTTATLSAPPAGGRQATLSCTVSAGISRWGSQQASGTLLLQITDAGSGYLTAPTVTVSPAPSGASAFPAQLTAAGDFDDGGYTIALTDSPSAGRYRACDVKPGFVDVRRFGWVVGSATEADNNSVRFNAARSALPVFGGNAFNGAIQYGQSWLDEPVSLMRVGTILLPGGSSYIGSKLVVTPNITLVTDPGGTTLVAKPGFAPSTTTQTPMLRLAVNGQFDTSVFPSPPNFDINATYNFQLDGHLILAGQYAQNNAGVIGCILQGAQGCAINGELETEDMSSGGMVTNLDADRLTSLSGKNPLIHFVNSAGNRVGHMDAEHGESDPNRPNDPDGDPHRFVLIETGQNIQIDYLSGEAFDLQDFCTIRGAGVFVRQCAENTLNNLFLIKESGRLRVDNLSSGSPTNVAGTWIDDRTRGVTRPTGTSSYVPTFNADTLTSGGGLLPTQVFAQPLTGGRFRLRAVFSALTAYPLQSQTFLVTLSDVSGQSLIFTVGFTKHYDPTLGTDYSPQANTQVVQGGGLVVTTTSASVTHPVSGGAAKQVTTDFAWSKPAGSFSQISVVSIAPSTAASGSSSPVVAWSAVSETQANVLNGTAPGASGAPVAPAVQLFDGTGYPTINPGTTKLVLQAALTSSVTPNLPAAASYPPGTEVQVIDTAGYTSTTNKLTYTPNRGDTLSGGATLQGAGVLNFYTDGAHGWITH